MCAIAGGIYIHLEIEFPTLMGWFQLKKRTCEGWDIGVNDNFGSQLYLPITDLDPKTESRHPHVLAEDVLKMVFHRSLFPGDTSQLQLLAHTSAATCRQPTKPMHVKQNNERPNKLSGPPNRLTSPRRKGRVSAAHVYLTSPDTFEI